MKLTAIWKKLSFTLLILAATLSLTACSYQKPERYTVKSLGVESDGRKGVHKRRGRVF